MKEHLKLLGYLVKDRITNVKGVVTSISFDVSGCVQGLVMPAVDNEGKLNGPYWFDTKRLDPLHRDPVVDVPSFDIIPGGQDLPEYDSKPTL